MQQSGRFGKIQWQRKQTMQISTLDQMINRHGLPKLIKIDVEGFEGQVLQGLSQMPSYISIEYAVPENLCDLIGCIQRLDDIAQKQVDFNYSIGESMQWASTNWLSAQQLLQHVQTQPFLATSFGDIYARRTSAERR
jgi:hypothetical protein